MPSGGLTLFRVRGIRIGVDWSWFFVLFLIILWLSGLYRDVLGASSEATGPYLLALASALLFFASILLHELGHAFVAMRRGISISEITLWMFGGVARMERDSDSPATEFKVAVAGPLVTLAIAAAAIAIGILVSGGSEFEEALRFEDDSGVSGLLTMLGFLAEVNLFVLIFNLIPAYPLDGGRIARAVAWWRTGDRNKATRLAATLGQGFSWVLIAAGVYLLIQGDVVGGIWLGVIGFILGQSARAAQVQTQVADKISGVTVADVMDAEPVAIPDDLSVERALDEYFLRYRWPWFPVVDAGQRFLGLLQRGAADAVPEGRRSYARVSELMSPEPPAEAHVGIHEPLESLLGNEALRRFGALAAVDDEGRLSGVITLDQVGRALRTALSGPSQGRVP
jgi:Zn-dependent protease/CBS domain-containing protein